MGACTRTKMTKIIGPRDHTQKNTQYKDTPQGRKQNKQNQPNTKTKPHTSPKTNPTPTQDLNLMPIPPRPTTHKARPGDNSPNRVAAAGENKTPKHPINCFRYCFFPQVMNPHPIDMSRDILTRADCLCGQTKAPRIRMGYAFVSSSSVPCGGGAVRLCTLGVSQRTRSHTLR